ncbi:MAG TPA: hypothetical protein VJ953_07380 [Saprospiraceae bacterium]|nr:hypothetical protein [Saprospiraceae bacterium]
MKYSTFFVAVIFLSLLSLFSCENPATEGSQSDTENPFFVRDPNHIYFKNVRSYYYTESLAPGGKPSERMNVYQLRKFTDTKERPLIYPKIIDNWIEDEAYLFLEGNDYPMAIPLTLFVAEGRDTSIIRMERPTPEVQWATAQKITEALEAERSLFILNEAREREPIFEQKTDRLAFLTTIKDFRRLTE